MVCIVAGLTNPAVADEGEGRIPDPFGDSGSAAGGHSAGSDRPSSGTQGEGGSTVVHVDRRLCDRAVAHVPDADVTHTPGVDVRGNAVAPADASDWSALSAAVKDGFVMDLAVDPYAASGREAPEALQDPSVSLGELRYDAATGAFTLNGRPLGDGQQARLAEACRRTAGR